MGEYVCFTQMNIQKTKLWLILSIIDDLLLMEGTGWIQNFSPLPKKAQEYIASRILDFDNFARARNTEDSTYFINLEKLRNQRRILVANNESHGNRSPSCDDGDDTQSCDSIVF